MMDPETFRRIQRGRSAVGRRAASPVAAGIHGGNRPRSAGSPPDGGRVRREVSKPPSEATLSFSLVAARATSARGPVASPPIHRDGRLGSIRGGEGFRAANPDRSANRLVSWGSRLTRPSGDQAGRGPLPRRAVCRLVQSDDRGRRRRWPARRGARTTPARSGEAATPRGPRGAVLSSRSMRGTIDPEG
jgi:hypothetical protein